MNISFFARIRIFLREFIKWIRNNMFKRLKKESYLIFNHSRRIKTNLTYNCVYTDLLINELKEDYIVFEEPYFSNESLTPIFTKNIYYSGLNGVKAKLIYYFFGRYLIKKKEKIVLQDICYLIKNNFNISSKDTLVKMNKMLILTKIKLKYYQKIISKVKPKVIVEVISYGFSKFLINHIAKSKNIPTIELQHGTMGKYHIAYNFKEKMNISTFPDYVFTFGQFWKDNTRFPIKAENIKVVGWPYFDNKVKENLSKTRQETDQKNILFISQGTIGKELSKEAVNLSKIISNDYRIIYKLHPGEYTRWKKEYPWLVNSNIEVIDHNNHDMHYYFSKADVQVGVYSTALFEGIAYYLLTYIFPFYGYEYLEELSTRKIVEVVSSAEELFNLIIQDIKNHKKTTFATMSEYLWSMDSLNKMIKEVETITEEKR
jgi:hypothetical protein